MQDSGLLGLIATARAATVVQYTTTEALQPPLLGQPPCTAQLKQGENTAWACSPAINSEAKVQMLEATAQVCDREQTSKPDMSPEAMLKAAQVKGTALVSGLTPEHMLYWVSQADIAKQLQCGEVAEDAAAEHLAAVGQEIAAHGVAGTHCVQVKEVTRPDTVLAQPSRSQRLPRRNKARRQHTNSGHVSKPGCKQLRG